LFEKLIYIFFENSDDQGQVLEFQEQVLDILQSYFRNAATYFPDAAAAGTTTYFSRVGMGFIFGSALEVYKLKPTSPLFSRHANLLQSLASGLRGLCEGSIGGSTPDYLFFASFTYVRWLFNLGSDIITTETGRDLILSILQYRNRVNPLNYIQDTLYNPNDCGWKYDDHWRNFVMRAGRLGIVVPPPASAPQPRLPTLAFAESQGQPPSGDVVVEVLHEHEPSIPSSTTDEDRRQRIESGPGAISMVESWEFSGMDIWAN